MEIVTIREMGIYETLYASLKKASEIEEQLRDGSGDFNGSNREAIRHLEGLASNELPANMGKLISELGMQPQFQSLGRYVRSFTDAEYVIRNLREQILRRLAGGEFAHAAIKGLMACCDLVTGQSDTAAQAYG